MARSYSAIVVEVHPQVPDEVAGALPTQCGEVQQRAGVGFLDKRRCCNCSKPYLARDCKGNGPGKFKGKSKDSKDKGKDGRKSNGKLIDGKGKGFDKKSEKYCCNCSKTGHSKQQCSDKQNSGECS